jgi:hypothetical protein
LSGAVTITCLMVNSYCWIFLGPSVLSPSCW